MATDSNTVSNDNALRWQAMEYILRATQRRAPTHKLQVQNSNDIDIENMQATWHKMSRVIIKCQQLTNVIFTDDMYLIDGPRLHTRS
jgi:hypothetical protein